MSQIDKPDLSRKEQNNNNDHDNQQDPDDDILFLPIHFLQNLVHFPLYNK